MAKTLILFSERTNKTTELAIKDIVFKDIHFEGQQLKVVRHKERGLLVIDQYEVRTLKEFNDHQRWLGENSVQPENLVFNIENTA